MSIMKKDSIREQLRETRDESLEVRDEVFGIIDDLTALVRKEVELAGAEFGEQAALSRNTAIAGGAAALLALLTVIFGALALTFGLAEAIPLWAAALITTGILAAFALVAAMIARGAAKRISLMPKRTMDSLSEDMRWARRQLTLNGKSRPSAT